MLKKYRLGVSNWNQILVMQIIWLTWGLMRLIFKDSWITLIVMVKWQGWISTLKTQRSSWLMSWTMSAEDLRKLEVTHIKWWNTVFGITLKERERNREIRKQCCRQLTVPTFLLGGNRFSRKVWLGRMSNFPRILAIRTRWRAFPGGIDQNV